MTFLRQHGGWLTTFLLSAALLVGLYGPVLLHPEQTLLAPGGDGLKTYYGLGYHLQHDSEWTRFHGMNYPYDEVVTYSVGHPLLALVAWKIPFLKQHFVGMVNLFALFSFVFTALVLYFLFRELSVRKWIATFSALAICLIQPQVYRLSSHIDLSYSWAIPLALYMIARYYRTGRLLIPSLLSLYILSLFLIHGYLGMMVSLFCLSFGVVLLLMNPSIRKKGSVLIITGGSAVGLFFLFAHSIDHHVGRGLPGGFMEMIATFPSLFLPAASPLGPSIIHFFDLSTRHWESWSYVGISTDLVLLVSGGLLLYLLVRKKSPELKRWLSSQPFVWIAMIASIPVVWFAMGYPFDYGYREWLFTRLTFVAQFRAPGRFAWIFFYAATVFSVFQFEYLLRLVNSQRQKIGAGIVVAALIGCYGWEGLAPNLKVSREIKSNLGDNWFAPGRCIPDEQQMLSDLNAGQYQAILPLPYFHIGSENYGKDTPDSLKIFSYVLSLRTGLPLCASQMARTAMPETLPQVQLYYEPFEYPDAIEHFVPDKPILVAAMPNSCNESERDILSLADPVDTSGSIVLYRLAPQKLADRFLRHRQQLVKRLISAQQNSADTALLYIDYNDRSEPGFMGTGGLRLGNYPKWVKVIDTDVTSWGDTPKITVSFWLGDIEKERVVREFCKFIVHGTQKPWRELSAGAYCHQVQGIRDGWGLVEYPLILPPGTDSLRIELGNQELPGYEFLTDEWMIRAEGDSVITQCGTHLLINNRPTD